MSEHVTKLLQDLVEETTKGLGPREKFATLLALRNELTTKLLGMTELITPPPDSEE